MTGGMAFVYDPEGRFERLANRGSILWQRLASDHWREELEVLVKRHVELTGSAHAKALLSEWSASLGDFWQVVPKDMVNKLEYPLSEDQKSLASAK